jgi:hypothetical protein
MDKPASSLQNNIFRKNKKKELSTTMRLRRKVSSTKGGWGNTALWGINGNISKAESVLLP